jgi:beta-ureidopropionase / N-carbamoyl-L-amino-acid hydrolase
MTDQHVAHQDLRIDGERLWSRIEALGEVGAVQGPNGERGCARLALTDQDRDGRDLVVSWMRDLGMSVVIDAIGNVVATMPGRDPSLAPVMTGSHIDTVRTGGRFDGNLGVLAGLEVVEVLLQEGITPLRSVQVAFFTDEEGSRFAPDMLGSLTYIGGLAIEDALDARDPQGIRAGAELQRIGYAGPTPCPAATFPSAFVELHIEQGPVLEAEGVTIGVVTGVQGISWTEVTIEGQSAHAGTTPMALRHDPMAVAGEVIVEMRDIARRFAGTQVCTVGRLDAFPNLTNVVPSKVVMTLDVRNTDEQLLQRAEQAVRERTDAAAASEGCSVSYRQTARFEPVEFDPAMIDLVEATAVRLGHSTMRMPSGAGHDAQMLARVCPTSMIFVESVNGLSHNIAEYTRPDDITAGANVLLQMLVELAERAERVE